MTSRPLKNYLHYRYGVKNKLKMLIYHAQTTLPVFAVYRLASKTFFNDLLEPESRAT